MWHKQIENGYIVAISINGGGTPITEAEYNEIMAIIHNKPQRTDTIDYRLKEDLTWEAFEVEPIEEPDVDDSELVNILLGVSE